MYALADSPLRARWEVLWIKPNGKRACIQCGNDFARAIDIYTKAVTAGRRAATLRCKNMGFPPPPLYADREVVIVQKGGKRFKAKKLIEPLQYRVTMDRLNREGKWWCPYCVKLRKFVKSDGFRVDNIWVPKEELVCPMCRIPHGDGAVQKYNPLALQISLTSSKRVADPDAASKKRAARAARRERRRRQQEEDDE